tara:strand:- start:569 stop:772 length:204 start_codon:yes stop_codon:yes gene_type:complete
MLNMCLLVVEEQDVAKILVMLVEVVVQVVILTKLDNPFQLLHIQYLSVLVVQLMQMEVTQPLIQKLR